MQTDQLEQFIVDTLRGSGLPDLDEEQINTFVPTLLAQLEQRIGIEMLPKLTEDHLDAFAKLIDNPDTTANDWQNFWYDSVPNFDVEIKRIMDSFAKDVKEVVS